MSQELHYTSVPRGLKPGSRGFATVAVTPHLPESLADRLESLSGYQSVFLPGDPSASLNPVVYAHLRPTAGNKAFTVVSRIGPAGLDYSGRPNKYAHHLVLDDAERPEGGPAWLLSQPGFLQTAWEGEPRVLDAGRRVPRGDRPGGVAGTWQALTGDAGWAGVLAESFLADPHRPAFLLFRPGMDVLSLFVEAIALLPPSRRWDVEFSTYFNTLPQGVSCTWRGVLDGSAEAKNARRLPNALIVNLVRPIPHAHGGVLVHLARTGELRERRGPGLNPPSVNPESRRGAFLTAGPPTPNTRSPAPNPQPIPDSGFELLPDLAARLAAPESLIFDDGGRRPPQRSRKVLIASAVAACVILMIAAGALSWSPAIRKQLGIGDAVRPGAQPIAERPPDTKGSQARQSAQAEPPKAKESAKIEGPGEPATVKNDPTRPDSSPTIAKAPETATKAAEKGTAASDPSPVDPIKPIAKATRPDEPVIVSFSLPPVPKSGLASPTAQYCELGFARDVDDRVEILNAPELRLNPTPTGIAWDLATTTGSGLAGRFTIARLSRIDARNWRFDWYKDAKNHSAQTDALRDAVLKFRARDGRAIFALLRGIEPRVTARPIIVENQPILFGLEPRSRIVIWSEPLTDTHWKLGIRRWKLAISRTDPEGKGLKQAFEPKPNPGEPEDRTIRPEVEHDLIPGQLKLKLSFDIENPDTNTIKVQFEPDRDKITEARTLRARRRKELEDATPRDSDGQKQDLIEYRRNTIKKLEEAKAEDKAKDKDEKAIDTANREIQELQKMNEIRQLEDFFSKPVRASLSVVIGLEIDASTILDIARLGEFAMDHSITDH